MIHEVLDGRAGSSGVADAVRAKAEGNPLFAEELLRSLLDTGSAHDPRGDVPSTIEQIVLERFHHCDEETRAVLERVAVIGRHFSPAFAAAIAQRPVEQVLEALKRARDQQLIVEESGPQTAFAFRHVLTRDAIYNQLLGAQRSSLHAAIAAALERRPRTARPSSRIIGGTPASRPKQPPMTSAPETKPKRPSRTRPRRNSTSAHCRRPSCSMDEESELHRKLALSLHHGGSAARARESFERKHSRSSSARAMPAASARSR